MWSNQYIKLFVWIVAFQSISGLLSIFSSADTIWYASLTRSSLTPPGYVFGIVWPMLYITIAIAGWSIWQLHNHRALYIKKLYIIQVLLNWSWTPIFFYFNAPLIALLCLAFILISLCHLLYQLFTYQRFTGVLLLPYLLWSLFAFYLNGYIVIAN